MAAAFPAQGLTAGASPGSEGVCMPGGESAPLCSLSLSLGENRPSRSALSTILGVFFDRRPTVPDWGCQAGHDHAAPKDVQKPPETFLAV
jgi:hypothetical protein